MLHVPEVTNVSAPPLVTVPTLVVVELNATLSPEVEFAVSVGVVPNVCVPGLLNVIVCAVFALFVSVKAPHVSKPGLAVTE